MKTKGNYPLNSKETHGKKYLVWILVAFIILFFLRDIVSSVSSFVTTPFYIAVHYIETSGATIPVFIRGRMELLHQIQTLETEIASQQGNDTFHTFLEKENEELRNLLNASSSPTIVAGVIARPPFTPYDSIIIDRGSDDGITENAPVYYGSQMALGYIRKVFSHSAVVTLFSSPGVASTVYVFGPNLFTTAYGEGGGVIRLSIPQGISIEEGNLVILPSVDTGVLGSISSIQSIPTEPEQHAYVTFDIPLQSLRLVKVGTSPVEPTTYEDAVIGIEEEARGRFMFAVPKEAKMDFGSTTTSSGSASSSTNTPAL